MAKTNKVPTDLGRWTNSHLGLMLSAEEYTLIFDILYVKIVHPGPLSPIDSNHLLGTVVAREEYKDSLYLFKDCTGVEVALLNQSKEVLLPLYLENNQDKKYQNATANYQSILNILFRTYGEITNNELRETKNILQEKSSI